MYLVLPSKVWEDFFQQETSHERRKTFLSEKNDGEVVLNRTNGQTMPRF